ncbi:transcription factor [Galdieria sulphuraria]|uniref:Transcription factor n=1 Tax=Galdieria sulphuraria TaxID=130081 RepID=M2X209_GALSU|nr:transcription factor [Galdieria sulphuraria]EME30380.1 transcription factor [Galdieria sulphuraria]|eukprot:XP_005706900.1 transcription factor [Galdieria sulphuraria]
MPKKNRTIIPLCKLRPLFHKPMREASKQLGTCLTVIKSSCRAHGISRWPYPEIQRISRAMEYLTKILELDSQGVIALEDEERSKFKNRYRKLEEKKYQLECHPECIPIEKESMDNGIEFQQHLEQISDGNTESCQKDISWSCRSENRNVRVAFFETKRQLNHISPKLPIGKDSKEDSSSLTSSNFGTSNRALVEQQQVADPCFLFLHFILRIGSRGVHAMGPELITEMAKKVGSSSTNFHHLTNIHHCTAVIESIQSKLQSLEANIEELKNQNEQLFQILKDRKYS